MQAEVFFIYHNGEQRGPYTAAQVNHLHRCGFIDDETLYWREGLEQWQPVGQIVLRRRGRRRVLLWSIILGVLAVIALFLALFGPVTAERWREMTSGEFTAESAWWHARGLVREQLPNDSYVRFEAFASADVKLQGKDGASVVLSGNFTNSAGATERGTWHVTLRYDESRGVWSSAPAPKSPEPAAP